MGIRLGCWQFKLNLSLNNEGMHKLIPSIHSPRKVHLKQNICSFFPFVEIKNELLKKADRRKAKRAGIFSKLRRFVIRTGKTEGTCASTLTQATKMSGKYPENLLT